MAYFQRSLENGIQLPQNQMKRSELVKNFRELARNNELNGFNGTFRHFNVPSVSAGGLI